ncbi:MAG: ribonuclease III [Candidatus Saccharimonadales bacterium]
MDVSRYRTFAKDTLKVDFNDLDVLVTAFTHRSYLNEHKKSVSVHNERLEFLGDAVLELVVTEYLYQNFPDPEGVLTNWRSSLVRTESIAQAAATYDFEPLLRLSRGEAKGSERARKQILANCFEAVIGAIYLDQGYDKARDFIKESIISKFKDILASGSWMDPKSRLQELAQSQELYTPIYRVINEEGPDHDKTFTVGVFVNNHLRGKGTGPSKQTGQQRAAEEALKYYDNKQG